MVRSKHVRLPKKPNTVWVEDADGHTFVMLFKGEVFRPVTVYDETAEITFVKEIDGKMVWFKVNADGTTSRE